MQNSKNNKQKPKTTIRKQINKKQKAERKKQTAKNIKTKNAALDKSEGVLLQNKLVGQKAGKAKMRLGGSPHSVVFFFSHSSWVGVLFKTTFRGHDCALATIIYVYV